MKLNRLISDLLRWVGSHIAIFFILWSLWLAFEYFGFGPNSFVRIHDNGDGNLPVRLLLASALDDNDLGYWIPQILSGVDRLSSSSIAEFDSLLFTTLPGWLAYGLMMWVQRFIAGYFTFRLLKDTLDLDTMPALYAGMAYSLFAQAGRMMAWEGFTLYDSLALPGLPFMLWAMSRVISEKIPRSYLYAFGLGILFSITSGYAYAPFTLVVIFFWTLFLLPRSRTRSWIVLLLFTIAWLFCEIPVVLPSYLNASLSHRSDRLANSQISKDVFDQVQYVIQLGKDNIISLGLVLVGLFVSRFRERRLLLLSGAFSLCLLIFIGYPLIMEIVQNYLGFLSGFGFWRVYIITPFLLIMAGGVGLHLIGQNSLNRDGTDQTTHESYSEVVRQRQLFYLQLILAAIAISVVGWKSLNMKKETLYKLSNGQNFAALYKHPDMQKLAKNKILESPFRVATIAVDSWLFTSLHPAYVWAYGLESVDGYSSLYSQRYQDYWEQVLSPLIKTDPHLRDYIHLWGNRVYLFEPSGGFIQDVMFRDYYDLDLLSLANVRYIISPLPLNDSDLTLIPSDVRDEQLVWADQRSRDKLLDMVQGNYYPGLPLYIYENHQVFPRFFLVENIRVFDDSNQVLDALHQANYDDLQSIAYLANQDILDYHLDILGGDRGELVLQNYSSDRITIEVETEVPSIMIATNNYSPYWTAYVDGVEVTVFPVNRTFQGVYIQKGHHEVVLEYIPPYSFKAGSL